MKWEIIVCVSLIASTRQAQAEDHQFVPSLAIEAGQYEEQMTLETGAESQADSRSLANTRLSLGLGYSLQDDWLGLGELSAHSSVGVGLIYYLGQWPVHARQEVRIRRPLTSWLALEAGVETGLQLNVSRWSHSYAELGLVMGVDIADYVEVLYLPAFVVALGSDREEVFSGSRVQKIDTGLQAINFALRVHFEALGW